MTNQVVQRVHEIGGTTARLNARVTDNGSQHGTAGWDRGGGIIWTRDKFDGLEVSWLRWVTLNRDPIGIHQHSSVRPVPLRTSQLWTNAKSKLVSIHGFRVKTPNRVDAHDHKYSREKLSNRGTFRGRCASEKTRTVFTTSSRIAWLYLYCKYVGNPRVLSVHVGSENGVIKQKTRNKLLMFSNINFT